MRVLIALASSSGQLSGVPRHAISLASCLLTRAEISAVHLVAAPWQREFLEDACPCHDARLHIHTAPIGNTAWSRNAWFYAQLPKLAAALNADIVHVAYPAPIRRAAFACPVVVTLHDLYPYDIPDNFGFPKVLFHRIVLRQCLRQVDAIACVSQSTQSRLARLDIQLATRKSVIVCNAVEPAQQPPFGTLSPKWSDKPFLLCVAQHRRNKNILLALQVLERMLRGWQLTPGTRMIVVGIPGPETPAIEDFVASSGLRENVVFANGVSEAQLQWCYRNCGVLLAPSSIEGFGLPVAEALLAGCRVVCSDIPAFRELGADHCRYVPLGSNSVADFANAIAGALCESRPEPVPLPQLASPVIAAGYMQLYRSLLPSPIAQRSSEQASAPSGRESRHPL